MGVEYRTFRFHQNESGLADREQRIRQMSASGWRIASETIEPGRIKGEQACCFATLCLPLGFLAGRTPGIVTLTFVSGGLEAEAGTKRACSSCGAELVPASKFCSRCGAQQQ